MGSGFRSSQHSTLLVTASPGWFEFHSSLGKEIKSQERECLRSLGRPGSWDSHNQQPHCSCCSTPPGRLWPPPCCFSGVSWVSSFEGWNSLWIKLEFLPKISAGLYVCYRLACIPEILHPFSLLKLHLMVFWGPTCLLLGGKGEL